MAKAWTGKEQAECSSIYDSIGLSAAMNATGRSRYSVVNKMKELGKFKPSNYNTIKNLKPVKRKFYAEDVASMFEMAGCGVKSSIIAEYFNTTSISIRSTMSIARKKGFEAYPLRSLK